MMGPPGFIPVPRLLGEIEVKLSEELSYGADAVVATSLMLPVEIPLGLPVESADALMVGTAVLANEVEGKTTEDSMLDVDRPGNGAKGKPSP